MRSAKILYRLVIALVICGAAYLVWRALNRYSISELADAARSIPFARVALAMSFAVASYACLTGFDFLAVRYAGKPLTYRRTALASFVSLSIGHTVGVAALSSGAIRYRFYSRWGLSAGDVAKVVIFCGITVALGLTTLAGIGLLLYPADAESLLKLERSSILGIAMACLLFPATYLLLSLFVNEPLTFRKWSLELPRPFMALGQVVIGTLNFTFVAACLHQLLAAVTEIAYLKVAAIYTMANGAALMSHVPGGLGVLEATVVYFVPGGASVGAMIVFRVVYFFIPLGFGLGMLFASEYFLRKPKTASEQASG